MHVFFNEDCWIFSTFTHKVFWWIFTHLKLCLATATHNFKWVKITHVFNLIANICKIWRLNTHFIPKICDSNAKTDYKQSQSYACRSNGCYWSIA